MLIVHAVVIVHVQHFESTAQFFQGSSLVQSGYICMPGIPAGSGSAAEVVHQVGQLLCCGAVAVHGFSGPWSTHIFYGEAYSQVIGFVNEGA